MPRKSAMSVPSSPPRDDVRPSSSPSVAVVDKSDEKHIKELILGRCTMTDSTRADANLS